MLECVPAQYRARLGQPEPEWAGWESGSGASRGLMNGGAGGQPG